MARYFTNNSSKKKFYAVVRGYNAGIYDSWEQCEPEVKGYRGQVYKSFRTRMEAEQYLHDRMRRAENHQKQGHQFRSLGRDDAGSEVFRCEYCLEMHRDAIIGEEKETGRCGVGAGPKKFDAAQTSNAVAVL